ncbi:class I SAM-dependent methyltransferase [Nocardia aurantia]|uniref:class I SAM-dependent methyltransferase n=1 Tax=Nocardia aurantia TaxID=2585199 RepID=UPI0038732405
MTTCTHRTPPSCSTSPAVPASSAPPARPRPPGGPGRPLRRDAHLRPSSPRRCTRGDAGRLPPADSTADAVTAIWLLHLIPPTLVTAALTEAARVLRPGAR